MMRLGVSGDKGSFSEEAAELYMMRENVHATLDYLIDMEGVLAAVETDVVDIGIFPVVNLLGGLVKPAFIAMGRHAFTPIDALWLEVHQCLLAWPGTTYEQITTIVSHPQGLAQCQRFLDHTFKGMERQAWIDTAKAVRDLAEGQLPRTTAVIAPARSASIYHMEILARDIQDKTPNLTAFMVVTSYTGAMIW